MDDGGRQSNGFIFYTNCFTYTEVARLAEVLH
jgi:hypothetical protein